jgi:hypothetical protein
MSASIRLLAPAALAAAFLLPVPAVAQTPAQQADKLNDEGKALFADKRYEDAHARFREAATLSPEGRFYFNMCYALNFLERYDEAIQACEQVEAAGADAALRDKTEKALASLRDKAAARSPARGATASQTTESSDDPTGPAPSAGEGRAARGASGHGVGPGPDPFVTGQAPPPSSSYKWSMGGSLGVLGNINTGRSSEGSSADVYGEGGGEVRFFANFIVSERARIGLQAFLGFGALAPADTDTDDNLVMGDIGGGVFIDLPLGSRVVLTPMVGPLLSIQQPQELSQGFFAAGGRAELAIAYVFGRQREHAISVVPAVNLYGPASGSEDDSEPVDFGLDEAHSTFGVSAGYTYRFSSPFGSVPLITLE